MSEIEAIKARDDQWEGCYEGSWDAVRDRHALLADNQRLREALRDAKGNLSHASYDAAVEAALVVIDDALASTEPEVCRCTDRQPDEPPCTCHKWPVTECPIHGLGKPLEIVNEEDSDGT